MKFDFLPCFTIFMVNGSILWWLNGTAVGKLIKCKNLLENLINAEVGIDSSINKMSCWSLIMITMIFCSFFRKLAVYDDWNQVAIHVAMDNTVIKDDLSKLYNFITILKVKTFLIEVLHQGHQFDVVLPITGTSTAKQKQNLKLLLHKFWLFLEEPKIYPIK